MGPSDVTPSLSYSLFGNDVKRWAINSFHNNVDSVHLFKLRNYHCMTNPINKIAISTTSEICSDQCTPFEYFLRGRTANFKTQPPYQKNIHFEYQKIITNVLKRLIVELIFLTEDIP